MCSRATLSLMVGLLVCGCQDEPTTTGVRLTILYDTAPERLRVLATADDGSEYGPELLPDPPRPLAAGSESLLLELTDALHDRTLALEVEGLDSNDVVMARGKRRVQVVSGDIVDIELRLTPARGCRDGRMLLPDGGCGPREVADGGAPEPSADAAQPQPDAGSSDASTSDAGALDGGCGVRCMDASPPVDVGADTSVADAGTPVIDAGCAASAACGDGVCCSGGGENASTCSADCAPVCGDTICSPSETRCDCPRDCGVPACGDGNCCLAAGETACACPQDCAHLCGPSPCPGGGGCPVDCREPKCDLACATGASCDWNCAGADECKGACSSGSTCLVDCTDVNNCDAHCGADAVCKLDCTGANNCRAKCGPNSECTVDCAGANNCDEIECMNGAVCTVLCRDAENCKFKRCDGAQSDCPDGTLVCGRDCP